MELHADILTTFIFFLITLLCMAACYYQKLIAPYKELPRFSVLAAAYQAMFKRIPKDITPVSFHLHTMLDYSKLFLPEGLVFLWFLQPYLFIFNEEAIKLFRNEEAALNKPQLYQVLQDLFGQGIFTSNGSKWKKQRKILNPVFNTTMLKDKVFILNQQADNLVKQLMKVPHDSVDIHRYLKLCTFSIICETIIGIDMEERKAELEHITELFSELTHKMVELLFKPWLNWLPPKYKQHFFPGGKRFYSQVKELREIMTKILLEMKEATMSFQKQLSLPLDETQEFCRVPGRSFAQRLVELHLEDPSSFPFEYMLDELITFIYGGYDTTSCTLLWCLFLLGHHQDVQDQVFNELESMPAGDVSFDDLSKLAYMECVIKESLRIYSTVPFHARRLEKNIQFGKYTVPKDTTIVFCPYVYHRNPEIFPDPENFDPNRFLEGSGHRPWTYIPFSEGLRSCIGKKLALMEIKIILCHLLRNFKITSLDRREDVRLSWELVLVPMKPLSVRLTPRHCAIQTQ